MSVVGFDFGTTNSLISLVRGKAPAGTQLPPPVGGSNSSTLMP
jgi:molecular chaperone DnaK (HSP70)